MAGAQTNDVEMPRAEPGGSHTVRRQVLIEVAAYGKAVWSWHPLLVSSWRRRVGPTGLQQTINSPTTVTRRIRRRGERGIRRQTIARGSRVFRGTCGPPCAVSVHGSRVPRAPGFLAPSDFHGAKNSCTTRALRAAG